MQTQTTLTPFGEGDRFALVLDRSTLDASAVVPNATLGLEIGDRAVPVRRSSDVTARRVASLSSVAP